MPPRFPHIPLRHHLRHTSSTLLPLPAPTRKLSTPTPNPSTSAPTLFDPHTKALQKARAALSPAASEYDYLRDEIATRLIDRLHDIPRTFPHALDLFCGSAHILRAVTSTPASSATPKIHSLFHTDIHPAILQRARTHYHHPLAEPHQDAVLPPSSTDLHSLPLPNRPLDLVLSSGALHWVNDLPSLLFSIRSLLKPDGLFLATMYGGETLYQLRISLQLAEDQLRNRLAPRISPMVRLPDMASLLVNAGFALPTVDLDRITVPFVDLWALMRHLKGMGETNALVARELHYGRDVFHKAAEIYHQRFGAVDPHGRSYIPATFEVVNMIGWAPAAGQPTPKERGSATVSFTQLKGAADTVVPDGAERKDPA